MNAKYLIAVLSLSAATGAAFADTTAPAARSRAEVIAEVQQAHASGQLLTSDAAYPFAAPAASSKTRAEVVSAVADANKNGQLLTTSAAYPAVAQKTESVSRAEVKAELKQALASGNVAALNSGA